MKSTFIIFVVTFANASSTEGDRNQTEASENANNRVFAAHTYFDINDKPVLANGHVGYVPLGDSIYMNGLFNGYIKTSSHRARVPNFANIYFESCGSAHTANKSRCSYKMDAKRALFQTNADIFGGNVTVEQTQYAHRYFDRAIVNTIELNSKYVVANGTSHLTINIHFRKISTYLFFSESYRLNINREWNGWSEDLILGDVITGIIADREVVLVAATTQTSEDPIYQNGLSKVFILYERIPKSIQIPSGHLSVSFTWLTIIHHSADDMEELFERLHAMSADDLLKSHTREWNDFWEENGISVHGNDELSKSIQSSLYAIASSLPSLKSLSENGPFYGLSPSGLGLGGRKDEAYEGHSFWDSETWILPAVLLIEPKWSEKILNYRHIVRQAARNNAQNAGYEGLR